MSILRPSDVTFLYGCLPGCIRQEEVDIHGELLQQSAQALGSLVGAHYSYQADVRAEAGQHTCDAGGTSWPFLYFTRSQDWNRSFRTDAFGSTKDISIEDDVAQNEYSWPAQ